MKTQLQYPNGLSITIEHDEQFAPQLLEMKEAVSSDAINAELSYKVESLQRTVCEYESALAKSENEISTLRTALTNIKMINDDNVATISALRIELSQIFKDAAPEIPTRHVSPSQQENFFKNNEEKPAEKAAPKWSKKPCSKCGELFQPTGPRSTVCENCKAEKQSEPAE